MKPPSQPQKCDEAVREWPTPTMAWYGVVILMCATIVAILDRQILSLMVDPIQQTLGLSDVEISVLQGPAFMIFYTLLGFPIGWLIDRTKRLRLIAIGVVVWTVGTVGCGLATSYEYMLVTRAIVGMGEAVVGPGAISLIADYFSPSRRALAVSVHGTAAMFGTGLALLGGGVLLSLATQIEPMIIQGLPPIAGWRFVFIASALPGFFVAFLALTASEPPRNHARAQQIPTEKLSAFLLVARSWILPHFSAVCLVAIMSYAYMSWLPSYLIRSFRWDPASVGLLTGFQFLLLGPSGVMAGGMLVRFRQRAGHSDAAVRVLRLASLLLALCLGALALPWPSEAVLLPVGATIFFISMVPTVSILAIQQATPNEFRGRLSAIYLIITNLIGYSAGPMVTAAFTQYLFAQADQIGYSLALIGVLAGPTAAVLFSIARPRYARLIGTSETELSSGNAETSG